VIKGDNHRNNYLFEELEMAGYSDEDIGEIWDSYDD
jgi:hypothetical protein